MNETIGAILIGVGAVFDLLGCIGLVRLPDVYNRLQAATKCVTLGTCMILVGVAVSAGWDAKPLAIKALLCAAFILLTSPVAAHALSRGAYRSRVPLCDASVEDAYAHSESLARHKARATEAGGRTQQEASHA
jgi:multicomponent Na+:H+ antiporter subunit G